MADIRFSRSAALTLLGGALAGTGLPAGAQTANPIVRMGAQLIEPACEPYYGDEAGIFVANGITPQVTTFTNGAAKTAKDLIGTTLGVGALGDFNQISLFAWLENNGVPRTSVKFVELPFPQIGPALERGQIQGGFIVEPAKSAAINAGQIRDFADTYSAIAPEVATVAWIASKAWLEKNRDVAKRLVKSIYATGTWADTHPDAAAAIVAKVAKIDLAVLNSVPRRRFATHFEPKYVENTLNLAARYGLLPRPLTVADYMAAL